jgi:GT2 family glycosyltransferase
VAVNGEHMKDAITIGIPTYNGSQRVENLLNNLKQRTESHIKHDIVVCDDSGRTEHQDKIKSICAKYGARFIFHPKNKGVPSAWNTLVKSSDSDYVILLNDDILVANKWLGAPLHALQENPLIGSFGLHCYFISPSDVQPLLAGPEAKIIPLNVRWDGPNLILNERFAELPTSVGSSPGRTMCPTGCAFGFSRKMWSTVGGFDERYQAFYEETDFGVACAEIGYPSVQLSCPGNYHIWSQTFGSAPEINASQVMMDSKRKFLEKWRERLKIEINDAPDINPFLMSKIPPIEIRWLDENQLQRTTMV